jgi:hypothetical protein
MWTDRLDLERVLPNSRGGRIDDPRILLGDSQANGYRCLLVFRGCRLFRLLYRIGGVKEMGSRENTDASDGSAVIREPRSVCEKLADTMMGTQPVRCVGGYRYQYKHTEAQRDIIVAALRAHDNMLAMLKQCLADYSHPNFTDRYGMADRLRKVIAKAEGRHD